MSLVFNEPFDWHISPRHGVRYSWQGLPAATGAPPHDQQALNDADRLIARAFFGDHEVAPSAAMKESNGP